MSDWRGLAGIQCGILHAFRLPAGFGGLSFEFGGAGCGIRSGLVPPRCFFRLCLGLLGLLSSTRSFGSRAGSFLGFPCRGFFARLEFSFSFRGSLRVRGTLRLFC